MKDEINKISLYKLFKWVKANLPSEDSNILLNGKLQLVSTNQLLENFDSPKIIDFSKNQGTEKILKF